MNVRVKRPIEVRFPSHGIFALESHHAPGWRMEPTRHGFLKCCYILKGGGTIACDQAPIVCRKDDIVVLPVGQRHCILDSPDKALSLYAICIEPKVLAHEPALRSALPIGRLPRKLLVASQIRGLFRRVLFEQALSRPAGAAMITGLTLELLAILARVTGRDELDTLAPATESTEMRARVENYAADLERRFFEDTSLDHVAMSLGMSRRRFTQLFRLVTGCSWLEKVQQLRINHAQKLLTETDRSVAAVAFECGYEDLSSFYRAFKRQTKVSPQTWRTAEPVAE